jgi:glycosyltransferase involved in cell wall biosynthesis
VPHGERPLKILNIIARLNLGGAAREVILECRADRDKGHEVLLAHGAVGPGEGSIEHLASNHSVPTLKIDELGPKLNAFGDIRALMALLRVMFREAPDVIHTHTAKAGALGRVSAALYNATRRRSKRALVLHTFHGHVFEGYFGAVGNAIVRTIERWLARLTDVIVTISARQRSDIVDRFRIAPDRKVVILTYGLDLEPLLQTTEPSAGRAGLGVGPDDVVLGYVGRFVPIKDLPTLVDAFAIVIREIPSACLVLAGDGPLRGEIESRVRELAIGSRVRFLGWTENLAELYAAFDMCVLSSINEGTPVAAIEAMATGKPVVGTAVGGVPDVVTHGRSGLLVPSGDPAALAAAIVTLVADSSTRQQFGAAARHDAEARYSLRRLADDIDRLYQERLTLKRGTLSAAR